MKFPYSSVISKEEGSDDFLVFRRPEIPVTVTGPKGSATYIGLVDTGSDDTIFPTSVAEYLGIQLTSTTSASAFGGQQVPLFCGDARITLDADGNSATWSTLISFYKFPSKKTETIVLGHAGFLDYFTATFDGMHATLTLIPNSDMPSTR